MDSRSFAVSKIKVALTHVEAAEQQLERAAMELNSVVGTGRERVRLGRLYDETRRVWRALVEKAQSGRCDVDEVLARAEREKEARHA